MSTPVSPLQQSKRALRKLIMEKLNQLSTQEIESQSKMMLANLLTLPQFQSAKGILCYLSMQQEAQTREIMEHVLAPLQDGSTLPPITSEDDKHVPQTKKYAFVPRVVDKTNMVLLRVYSQKDIIHLKRNKWGIPEPEHDVELKSVIHDDSTSIRLTRDEARDMTKSSARTVDIAIIPGVAYDEECHRLGHGRGYYDRYLVDLVTTRKAAGLPPPLLVGLGLDCQYIGVNSREVDVSDAKEGSEGGQNTRDSEDEWIRVPVGDTDVPLDVVVLPSRIIRKKDQGTKGG